MNRTDSQLLSPATRLGYVHLTVSDLKQALAFYPAVVGLQVLTEDGPAASLGAEDHEILRLTEVPGARSYRGTTGLYHFAILVPDRPALGQALKRILVSKTRLGASDHLVSEALYISDPDGNGIEIYCDRPRAQWPYSNGSLEMAVDPLDLEGLLAEAGDGLEPELPGGTVLGHIHLHVSNLDAAESFYLDGVGFERMLSWYGQASFVSAGGYHHHLGLNTWAGVGASSPPPQAVGLRYFTIEAPDAGELESAARRLQERGYALQTHAEGIMAHDPSQNAVLLSVTPSTGIDK